MPFDSHLLSSRRSFFAAIGSATAVSLARAAEDQPTLPTFNDEMTKALNNAPLKMKFTGSTATEFTAWHQEFSVKLRTLIGPHHPPADFQSELLSQVELSDHFREEWLLKAKGVPSLPLYILRPKKADQPLPIILALHGHGPHGHDPVAGVAGTPERDEAIRQSKYDYGRQLVREGYLVAVPCFTPFGRRITDAQRNSKTDQCAVAFIRLAFSGQTLLGANLRDVRWALDFASQRKDARPDRVGCVGLSYGGRMTMVATAVEPRIKAAVVSGALNVFQERALGGGYSCGAQAIPGLLEFGDTPEIGSLIAPRPCIWEMGSRDSLIVPGWADQFKERLKKAYAAAGKSELLEFHDFEGGHSWSGVTAVPMLAKYLKS